MTPLDLPSLHRSPPCPPADARPLSHKRTTPLREFLYGSPYYPEHWDAATRAADPALFRAAGWNVIRLAEFAWDILEPREGTFDFTLFDETIAAFAAHGIRTIFCTPTATPPRWLTAAHPEVLRVNPEGQPMVHGSRQHASHLSPLFRTYSRRITQALADHYKHNPHVIGWQTDNEFHCHFHDDHSPAAAAAWIEWLRARYRDDVAALNRDWGNAFWGLTYTRFADIPPPVSGRPTHPNPSAVLDWQRFLSDGVAAFQRDQVELLRAAQPRWWITHNGCFRVIDYRGPFTRDLDFLGYDAYPNFERDPARRPSSLAANLDTVRAYSGHFLILEQQSGPGGQDDYFLDCPEPGEMRLKAYVSIARGADGLLFFRERTCRFGAEEYWCGILDHDNVPRRRYHEAAQLGRELARFGTTLLGTHVHVDIGIAGGDFDSVHGHLALSHGLPTPKQMAETIHGVFYRSGHAVGIIHPEDNLDELALYFVPHFALFDPARVPALTRFVARGGTLVIGARSACKDLRNQVTAETLPAVLRPLVGATVEEYGRQNRPDLRPLKLRLGTEEFSTTLWYESLRPDPGTEVLAPWTSRHLTGQAAITRRAHGKGQVIYVGTYLTVELITALVPELTRLGALPAPIGPGGKIETVLRRGPAGEQLRFILNHADSAQTISLRAPGHDLISDRAVSKTLTLPAYDVALISEG